MKKMAGCLGNMIVMTVSVCFGVMLAAVGLCLGLQFIVSSLL